MADGPPGIRGIFTRDCDNLADLFRRKRGRRARAGVIGQSRHEHRGERFIMAPIGFYLLELGGQCEPSLAPCMYRLTIEAHLPRHVALGGSRLQRSKNLGTPYQPLGTCLPAHNLLQASPLSCCELHPGGYHGD
jgi:hypothetical protein